MPPLWTAVQSNLGRLAIAQIRVICTDKGMGAAWNARCARLPTPRCDGRLHRGTIDGSVSASPCPWRGKRASVRSSLNR